jgi:hypothetical protein
VRAWLNDYLRCASQSRPTAADAAALAACIDRDTPAVTNARNLLWRAR